MNTSNGMNDTQFNTGAIEMSMSHISGNFHSSMRAKSAKAN